MDTRGDLLHRLQFQMSRELEQIGSGNVCTRLSHTHSHTLVHTIYLRPTEKFLFQKHQLGRSYTLSFVTSVLSLYRPFIICEN